MSGQVKLPLSLTRSLEFNSMKKTFTMYLSRYESLWSSEPEYTLRNYKTEDDNNVFIKEVIIDVEFPEGEYIPERVANIDKEIKKTYVEAAEKAATLIDRKEKLLCITNEPVTIEG